MAITASQVNAFRQKTGLPMMDCKKALEACDGDEEKAIEWLRAQGLGRVQKMADRVASEGRIACAVEGDCAGIVELRCETAPVSNTDDFIRLVNTIAKIAARAANPTAENVLAEKLPDNPGRTLQDEMNEVFNRMREKMQIARVSKVCGNVGQYVHHNGQVGVVVSLSAKAADEVKTDLCMHIAAMRPTHMHRDLVEAAAVAKEKAVFAEEASSKPAAAQEKIIAGKLGRWFSEFVLLEQPFVKDDKRSVADWLKSHHPELTVKNYVRYQVGGS